MENIQNIYQCEIIETGEIKVLMQGDSPWVFYIWSELHRKQIYSCRDTKYGFIKLINIDVDNRNGITTL
jgi:hypothetical protein